MDSSSNITEDNSSEVNIVETPEAPIVKTEVTIETLLVEFELPELIPVFKEKEIDVGCLKFLEDTDLKELDLKFSQRIKFRGKLNEWKHSHLKNVPTFSPSQKLKEFNLRELLKTESPDILEWYTKFKTLNKLMRKRLVEVIATHCVNVNLMIGTKEASNLADDIIQIFPTEEKESYFITAAGGSNAKGSLYVKFNNVLREARSKGLVQPSSAKKKLKLDQAENLPESTTTTSNTEITKEELEEKKKWLARFNKPWEVVESNWLQTARLRRDQLLACKSLTTFVHDEWPLLSNTEYGPILITQDFKQSISRNDFFKLWADFKVTFLAYVKSETKPNKSVKSYLRDIEAKGASEDDVNYSLLKVLFNVLPPQTRSKGANGKLIKTSIPNSIESVLLPIGPINNIDLKYEAFQKANVRRCQPVIFRSDDKDYFVIYCIRRESKME